MRLTAKFLRLLGFGVLVAVAVFGGLFAAGYALADLTTYVAVTGIVLWLAVAGGLSWLAFRAPDLAVLVMMGAVALVTTLSLVDGRTDLFNRDVNGPVTTLVVLSVFAPLAVLGLRRSVAAGVMLLVLAASVLLATMLTWWVRAGEAPPPTALLRGSSSILLAPMVLAGVLFVVAGLMSHESYRFRHPAPGRPVAH